MTQQFRADLHTHTSFSDGTLSPEELIDKAIEVGLSGLAITDHDTIDAYTRALAYAKSRNFPLLGGVEFSTHHYGESFHLLAYCFRLNDPLLQALCTKHKTRRKERNRLMLERLNQMGIEIEESELLPFLEGSVGRPHIAKLLVEKGVVRSISDAFSKYIGDGKAAFVPGERMELSDTIDVVHKAGGIAILAHPHLMKRQRMLRRALELPLDGLECYYARLDPSRERPFVEIAEGRNWWMTGGSDFHGENRPHTFLGSSWVGYDTFDPLYERFLKQNAL